MLINDTLNKNQIILKDENVLNRNTILHDDARDVH